MKILAFVLVAFLTACSPPPDCPAKSGHDANGNPTSLPWLECKK